MSLTTLAAARSTSLKFNWPVSHGWLVFAFSLVLAAIAVTALDLPLTSPAVVALISP